MIASRAGGVTFLGSCLLALWLGASLFFAAVVAPAAFAVLPTPGLAGALVGRTLPSLFISGMIVGVILIALEIRFPRAGGRLRGVSAGVMLTACGIAQFGIGAQIARLRDAVGSPAALSQDDPRRRAFGRLHALSVAALGASMVAAAAAAAASRPTVAAEV